MLTRFAYKVDVVRAAGCDDEEEEMERAPTGPSARDKKRAKVAKPIVFSSATKVDRDGEESLIKKGRAKSKTKANGKDKGKKEFEEQSTIEAASTSGVGSAAVDETNAMDVDNQVVTGKRSRDSDSQCTPSVSEETQTQTTSRRSKRRRLVVSSTSEISAVDLDESPVEPGGGRKSALLAIVKSKSSTSGLEDTVESVSKSTLLSPLALSSPTSDQPHSKSWPTLKGKAPEQLEPRDKSTVPQFAPISDGDATQNFPALDTHSRTMISSSRTVVSPKDTRRNNTVTGTLATAPVAVKSLHANDLISNNEDTSSTEDHESVMDVDPTEEAADPGYKQLRIRAAWQALYNFLQASAETSFGEFEADFSECVGESYDGKQWKGITDLVMLDPDATVEDKQKAWAQLAQLQEKYCPPASGCPWSAHATHPPAPADDCVVLDVVSQPEASDGEFVFLRSGCQLLTRITKQVLSLLHHLTPLKNGGRRALRLRLRLRPRLRPRLRLRLCLHRSAKFPRRPRLLEWP